VSHELFQGLWVIIAINHQMACQKESTHKSRWNHFFWLSWEIMTHYERKRVIKGYYGTFDIFQMIMVLDLQNVHMLRNFLGATQTIISLQKSQITFQVIFSQFMYISPIPFFMKQDLQASFLLSATCKSFIQGRYASSMCKLSNHSMVHSKIIKVSDDEIFNENTSAKSFHQSNAFWLHSLQY
jgi:hypothetical protein